MQEERDTLVKRIFSAISKTVRERSATVGGGGLTWGHLRMNRGRRQSSAFVPGKRSSAAAYFIASWATRYGRYLARAKRSFWKRIRGSWQHLQQSGNRTGNPLGAIHETGLRGHAYFYFRDPRYVESIPEGRQRGLCSEDAGKCPQTRSLKRRIRDTETRTVAILREGYANPEDARRLDTGSFYRPDKQALPSGSNADARRVKSRGMS